MAITAQFLSQCTDEQINKGVAWLLVSKFSLMTKGDRNELDYYAAIDIFNRVEWGFNNYCTNPSDIMPIQIANRIDLYFNSQDFSKCPHGAYKYLGPSKGLDVENANPLRAICEVYILMSVSK